MKALILRQFRKKKAGTVVEVPFGYYKNFLNPLGIACIPTEEALEAFKASPKTQEVHASAELLAFLSSSTFEVFEKGNDAGVLYSSVSKKAILEVLIPAIVGAKFDVTLSTKNIELNYKIKLAGDHVATILFDDGSSCEVKISVKVL